MEKDLSNLKVLLDILHEHRFYTKKDLWQNFLVDPLALNKIITTANLTKDEVVIEIWPWPWVLTQALLATWAHVKAIEFDRDVIPILKWNLWNKPNLEIIHCNALEYQIMDKDYILCANIPYYLTSPILKYYLSGPFKPKRAILMVQKEVAHKICCRNEDQSILSLEVMLYWKPSIVLELNRNSFFPPPKVDSSVIFIDVYESPLISLEQIPKFWHLAEHLFKQRRKMISNTLASYKSLWREVANRILLEAKISPSSRPQTLTIAQWKAIIEIIGRGS